MAVEEKVLCEFLSVLRASLQSEVLALRACALESCVPGILYDYLPGGKLLLDQCFTAAHHLHSQDRLDSKYKVQLALHLKSCLKNRV